MSFTNLDRFLATSIAGVTTASPQSGVSKTKTENKDSLQSIFNRAIKDVSEQAAKGFKQFCSPDEDQDDDQAVPFIDINNDNPQLNTVLRDPGKSFS